MDQTKIGKHIAEKRKALGLMQAALAQKLGVTDKSVSKWERGVCIRDEHYGTFCAWKGEMERTGEDSGYNISGVTPQWSSSRVYPGQEIPLLQYQLGIDMMQTCDVLSAAVGHLPPDGRTNEEYLADELQKAEYVLCLSCRFDRNDP